MCSLICSIFRCSAGVYQPGTSLACPGPLPLYFILISLSPLHYEPRAELLSSTALHESLRERVLTDQGLEEQEQLQGWPRIKFNPARPWRGRGTQLSLALPTYRKSRKTSSARLTLKRMERSEDAEEEMKPILHSLVHLCSQRGRGLPPPPL